ncbi:MAG TPA: hypothetical protein VJG30_04115 [Candidatus Nanoarchaeia archaeon]|nr:hypothetical protein [Candidatus Nanoarchaeia archaeon]
MDLTSTQRFILFTLGIWYEEANRKLKDKDLEVFISKVVFIEVVRKARMVEKEERALYKNLELLERKRFISYNNKNIVLTSKGFNAFNKIKKGLSPYINVIDVISKKDPLSYSKRIQTRLVVR